MNTILAFGDSLTWGTDPVTDGRHPLRLRWPTVVQQQLGEGWHVVAEGLGGRTTAYDDPDTRVDRNGAKVLPVLLSSHFPLELVVILLGLNDLKQTTGRNAEASAAGLERLMEIIRDHPYRWGGAVPRVLVVAPPHLRERRDGAPVAGGRVIAESLRLAPLFRAVSERFGGDFLDAAEVAQSDPADGVHLSGEATLAIGLAIAERIAAMITPRNLALTPPDPIVAQVVEE